jgi:hypothetical protein
MAVLSRLLQVSVGLLATAGINATPLSTPLERRGTIASDEIVGFPETVPSGTVGDVYLAYQPYLYVENGCVPFPAVDAEGDTKYANYSERNQLLTNDSAGLATTGASNGDCSSSTGQIYVRGSTYGDYYGLMYAWYVRSNILPDQANCSGTCLRMSLRMALVTVMTGREP